MDELDIKRELLDGLEADLITAKELKDKYYYDILLDITLELRQEVEEGDEYQLKLWKKEQDEISNEYWNDRL